MFLQKKHIANCITTTGIITGIIACFMAWHFHSFWWSFWWSQVWLIIALILDGLDGKVARKYGSHWMGAYLDDIADSINFGLHPAVWIYIITDNALLAVVFFACIAYRLVRFTFANQSSSHFFVGLPSPAGAIAIFGILFVGLPQPFIYAWIILISVLSCSWFPHIHVVKSSFFSKKHVLLLFLVTMLAIVLVDRNRSGLALIECGLVGIYSLLSLIIFFYTRDHD